MEIGIYFHRDFDGLVSAALIADYAYERWKGSIRFYPLSHGYKEKWLKSPLRGDITYVLDFAFHEGASFWFDHHQTGLEHYLGPLNKERHFFDPSKSSCAILIWEVLYEKFSYRNLNLEKLVNWADIIDGAKFSLKDLVECKERALQIHLSLSLEADNAYLIELARLFFHYKDAILRSNLPYIVEWRFKKAREYQRQSLEKFKKIAKFDPKTGIVTFFMSRDFFYCRWAPYYVFPDCKYSLGVINTENERYMVIVNENPFSRSGKINIGKICAHYGGGGHLGVGGINVSSLEEGQRIVGEIKALIENALIKPKGEYA